MEENDPRLQTFKDKQDQTKLQSPKALAKELAALGWASDLASGAGMATMKLVSQGVLPDNWGKVLGDLIVCNSARLLEKVLPICADKELLLHGQPRSRPGGCADAWRVLLDYLGRNPCKKLELRAFHLVQADVEAIQAGLTGASVASEIQIVCTYDKGEEWRAYAWMMAAEKASFSVSKGKKADDFVRAFRSVECQAICRLRSLTLHFQSLPASEVLSLAEGLRSNRTIEELSILPYEHRGRAFASDVSLAEVYRALIGHPLLRKLHVAHVLDAGAAVALTDLLEHTRLRDLTIDATEAAASAGLARAMRQLTVLTLNAGGPAKQNLAGLWTNLDQDACLQRLTLYGCLLDQETFDALAGWVEGATHLSKLRLVACRGGQIQRVLDAAAVASSIRHISLKVVPDPSLRFDSLARSASLKVLVLDGMELTANCLQDLLGLIRQDSSIVDLRLRQCNLDAAAIRSVADALVGRRRLRALNLDGNPGCESEFTYLCQTLGENQGLQSLKVLAWRAPAQPLLSMLRRHRDLLTLNYDELGLDEEAYAEVVQLLQRNSNRS